MKKHLLQNNQIRLRALEPEDLDILYKWENNTLLWEKGDTVTPYSRYTLKQYLAEAYRGIYELKQLRLIIEEKTTRESIGMIDLYEFDPHNKKAGVGILIDIPYQNKGLGKLALSLLTDYALSFLKLHQIYAYIAIENHPSQQLFKSCGFQLSGTLRDWISSSEGYTDVQFWQLINSAIN